MTQALCIGGLFFLLAGGAIPLGCFFFGLGASEVISLCTGAVTAAALTALFLQVRAAREDAGEREKQRSLEMALRADQLHAEFNSPDMRRHRDLAYPCLQFLKNHDHQRAAFARSWLSDEKPHIQMIPDGPAQRGTLSAEEPPTKPAPTFEDYSWAVSAMVAFYVRLATHIEFYEKYRAEKLDEPAMASLIGPFYWNYWWEAGFPELVKACEDVESPKFGPAYFIHGLTALDQFSARATGRARSGPSSLGPPPNGSLDPADSPRASPVAPIGGAVHAGSSSHQSADAPGESRPAL